jgi:hypothetical protein
MVKLFEGLVDQRNRVLINDPNQTLTTEYKPVKMQS